MAKPKRKFLVQEVPKEHRTPRIKTVMAFNEKTKTNELKQEPYMPDEVQYDVITNASGSSLRLLKSELSRYGFDRDPFGNDPEDDDPFSASDADVINIAVGSEEIPNASR